MELLHILLSNLTLAMLRMLPIHLHSLTPTSNTITPSSLHMGNLLTVTSNHHQPNTKHTISNSPTAAIHLEVWVPWEPSEVLERWEPWLVRRERSTRRHLVALQPCLQVVTR